jgi:hypothetical protein
VISSGNQTVAGLGYGAMFAVTKTTLSRKPPQVKAGKSQMALKCPKIPESGGLNHGTVAVFLYLRKKQKRAKGPDAIGSV